MVGSQQAKGRQIIESELHALGCEVVQDGGGMAIIGTLSPGPMLDLQDQHPDAIAPWSFQ